MGARRRVDVLHVSPGTTAGWRRADDALGQALCELGLEVVRVRSGFGAMQRHRRGRTLRTDLAEALAMRHALGRALGRWQPRAVVYSTVTATLLQPRGRLRGAAIRFDTPAFVNRPAGDGRLQRALERRSLRRAGLLLPWGLEPHPSYAGGLPRGPAVVALPVPVDAAPADPGAAREPLAVAYAGFPEKKGLDLVARAWRLAAPSGMRLVVTGIDREHGEHFLRRSGLAGELQHVEWAGPLGHEEYRRLLARAELYIAASRFEDYGLAQLEALADGALLVTLPSPGPFEALPIARRLDPRLVAGDMSGEALGRALGAALALTEDERRAYRAAAREAIAPYSRDAVRERLERHVVPLLLAG